MTASNLSSALRPLSTMGWHGEVQQPPAQPACYRAATSNSHVPPGMQGQKRLDIAGVHVATVNPGITVNSPFAARRHDRNAFPSPPTGSLASRALERIYRRPLPSNDDDAVPQPQQMEASAVLESHPGPQPGAGDAVASASFEVPAGYEYINWYTGTPHDPRYMDTEGIYYFPPEYVLLPSHLLRWREE